MDKEQLLEKIDQLNAQALELAAQADALALQAANMAGVGDMAAGGGSPFLFLFTAFVLACFVGYYVVWSVTPALHSPLMGVTNAISSVIIVGALIAAGPADMNISKVFGFIAVVLASVNIFGGFVVTNRMLSMFKKKDRKG
ncbi:MAG: NAD(P) transhydrogenase subunit alpha [Alphaproteobacteria bacterium]|nr:NAD(P) transhydrogenase subunit alpha [Alphaproteobacteria bacterium]